MTKQYKLTYACDANVHPCSVYMDADLTKQTPREAAEGWLRARIDAKTIVWSLWTSDDEPDCKWIASGTFDSLESATKKKYKLEYSDASRQIDAKAVIEIEEGAELYTSAENWLGNNTSTDCYLDWILDTMDGKPASSGCFKRNWKPQEKLIAVRGETYDDGVAFAKDISKLKHADAPWWDGFCWQMQEFANDDAFNDYQLAPKHAFDAIMEGREKALEGADDAAK